MQRYRDRKDAGKVLADILEEHRGEDNLVVLALPRGGIPVAEPIARLLEVPLGVFVVRKIGIPGQQEVAMGAIGSGGVDIRNQDIMRAMGISEQRFAEAAAAERRVLQGRERQYLGHVADLDLQDKTVILVDDGIATGASLRVAIKALRRHKPGQLTIAVPVAPQQICTELLQEVDVLVCPLRPLDFTAVSVWYDDFSQVNDDEVRQILDDCRQPASGS